MISNFRDVLYYLQGKFRAKLYYSGRFYKLLRKHIVEQIDYRILEMNQICYMRGSCIHCGCETTALQMADKTCDGYCYPTMMNKEEWEKFKLSTKYLRHYELGKDPSISGNSEREYKD